MSSTLVRLFRFRPAIPGAVLDVRLRDATVPAVAELPQVLAVLAGRRGADPAGERVLVTVWESEDGLVATAGSPRELLLPERELQVEETEVECVPIAVHVAPETDRQPQVIRIFTGITRAGELDAYVEEAREGAMADIAAGHGPVSLYLAVERPDRFITVSTWTDWTSIEHATGGNIHRPIATHHAGRLAVGTADHYEVVPGTARAIERRPAPVD